MNTNLRAILFGAAVAAALTIALDTVAAERVASTTQVVRLGAVQITAHRDAFDAAGNLKAAN